MVPSHNTHKNCNRMSMKKTTKLFERIIDHFRMCLIEKWLEEKLFFTIFFSYGCKFPNGILICVCFFSLLSTKFRMWLIKLYTLFYYSIRSSSLILLYPDGLCFLPPSLCSLVPLLPLHFFLSFLFLCFLSSPTSEITFTLFIYSN